MNVKWLLFDTDARHIASSTGQGKLILVAERDMIQANGLLHSNEGLDVVH